MNHKILTLAAVAIAVGEPPGRRHRAADAPRRDDMYALNVVLVGQSDHGALLDVGARSMTVTLALTVAAP